MNLRGWVRWLLFLCSYAPLFLILMLRTSDHSLLPWVFGALTVVPTVVTLVVLRTAKKAEAFTLQRVVAKDRAAEGASYFASYVISFVPGSDPSVRDTLSLAVLLTVLGAVYVNSSLIHLNPTLALLKWHVYDVRGFPVGVENPKRRSLIVLSQSTLEAANSLSIVHLTPSVAVAKP